MLPPVDKKYHEAQKGLTTKPVRPGKIGEPEFCRTADCRNLFGLSRTFAYQLINAGKIKSVCLRKPGARTGIRLLHVASIRDYLNSEMAAANSE